MLSDYCDHHCIQQFIWKWRSPDIFNQQRKRKYKKSGNDHEYIIFNAVYLWSGIDGEETAAAYTAQSTVKRINAQLDQYVELSEF